MQQLSRDIGADAEFGNLQLRPDVSCWGMGDVVLR